MYNIPHLPPHITPRWYQIETIERIYSYFSKTRGNPLIAWPTGTGKSLGIGMFAASVLQRWPTQRMLMLTHVKELIEQNASKLLEIWPDAPLGIYSAGLNSRENFMPIVYGGVASVFKNLKNFGHIDVLQIDEAHLLSPNQDGMYLQIIEYLRRINPKLVVIGWSATPFRMGQGMLTNPTTTEHESGLVEVKKGLFTDLIYNLCTIEGFERLIAEGYLVPPVPKRTSFELDTSGVGLNKGEYNLTQLQNAVNHDDITVKALSEAAHIGRDRRKGIVFASGIDHAEAVTNICNLNGLPATVIHSKISQGERNQRIADFKAGRYRWIVNNNVLTTGFDCPEIDLEIILRPTLSSVLWVQMLGRGTRPFTDGPFRKENCLVLDFAGNARKLGPINDPKIPNPKGGGGGGAPVRLCEACDCYSHARAKVCEFCGAEFTYETKISDTAYTDTLLACDIPEIKYFDVDRVLYSRHKSKKKENSPPMIKVTYVCGFRGFTEYVRLEHPGFAGKWSRDWWRSRHWDEPPATTDEALVRTHELRQPARIRVWVNKKYPEVLGHEFA